MKGYYYLIATIVIEALAVVLIKLAKGTENKLYFASGLFAFFVSFLCLSQALKSLEMGFTNAVWAGSSLILVYILSVCFFQEKITVIQGIFILCILIGIVGLNLTSKGD